MKVFLIFCAQHAGMRIPDLRAFHGGNPGCEMTALCEIYKRNEVSTHDHEMA